MGSRLRLEKAGVAIEGSCSNQSYHPPWDYMCAYAILWGGSRDILGEILALQKLIETLQVLVWNTTFSLPMCSGRLWCWHQQEARWLAQPALQQKESPGVTIHFRWTIGNQAEIAKQMVSHQASAPPLPARSAFKEKREDGEKNTLRVWQNPTAIWKGQWEEGRCGKNLFT